MASLLENLYRLSPNILQRYWVKVEASPIGMRMARGAFWSLLGAIISRGMMLIASIFIARMLGRDVYGEFGMVRSTVGLFAVFAGFGLGVTATKHIAEFRHIDVERAGRIMVLAGVLALVTGTLAAIVIFIFAPWLAKSTLNAPHLAPELRIGALILLINGLNSAQTGALAGFEAFKSIAKVNLVAGLSSFPILVAGAYLGGLRGAVLALLFNVAINWFLNHLALRKEANKCGVPFSALDCWCEWPVLWKFSLPAVLGSFLVSPVIWACNAFLVNQPGGYAHMGIFDAANQWRIVVLFIPGIVGTIVMPMLSNLVNDNDRSRYKKVLSCSIFLNGSVALAVAVPLLLFAPWAMKLYGKGFEAGGWVLVCLVCSAVLIAVNDVIGQAIASSNKMWIGFSFNLLWAIVLVVCGYWFTTLGFGALGLAVANLIAYLFHSIIQTCYIIALNRG